MGFDISISFESMTALAGGHQFYGNIHHPPKSSGQALLMHIYEGNFFVLLAFFFPNLFNH